MTLIEKTAYPVFTDEILELSTLESLFTPSSEEISFINRNSRTGSGKLTLLILLKTHQFSGQTLPFQKIPERIQNFLRLSLGFDQTVKPLEESGANKTSFHRYRQSIRNFLSIKPWSKDSEQLLVEVLEKAAYTMSDPADLINLALETLSQNKYELPAFSTLDRLAKHIRQSVHERIYEITAAHLKTTHFEILEKLLVVGEEERQSDFNKIKAFPPKNSLKHMRLWSDRLAWLDSILKPDDFIKHIAHTKVRQFAAQTRQLELGDMKDIVSMAKRHTFLLCFLHEAQIRTRDELVTMFLKRIRLTHHQAKEEMKKLQENYRLWEEQILAAFNEVVNYTSNESRDRILGKKVRALIEQNGGSEQLTEQYQIVSALHGNNHLPLLWKKHRMHRRAIYSLLELLDIQSTTQDDDLLQAFDFIKEYQHARRDFVPINIELKFLSSRWKNYVLKRHEGQSVLDRRAFEIAVLSHLADALRCGDLYITDSEEFSDIRKQLLSWDICETHLKEYCQGVALPDSPQAFIDLLQKKLRTAAENADRLFPENTEFSVDENGVPHLKRFKAKAMPKGFKEFSKIIRRRMPEQHLLDILKNVEHWSNFTKHFSPPSGVEHKMKNALSRYLFTVFGYGCNLGAAQTAKHIRGEITLRTLKRINDQHITPQKLYSASVDVINQYARFGLISFWGNGNSTAADGTHIPLIQNNLLGEQHIRYGGYGGIAYHHISDTYIALFCNFFACGVWEAVYILDGLMKNTSKLQPDTVHADTQGQNEPVFGLSYLLGIQLMPRMRNWADVKFYRANEHDAYKNIDRIFNDTVNWNLIKTHWKDLMQVVISIHRGKILPSVILQKLGTNSRKNKLYKAFRELGRVIRTIFLLQYINSSDIRQKIHATTNKVESFHFFHDWITFGGFTITTGDPIEQLKRNKYIDLIANVVMLHNVIDLTAVINQIKLEGQTVPPEFIQRLSPYMTEHIKRFGQYVLDIDDFPKPFTQINRNII